MTRARYSRQTRLPEIGEAGQAKLARSVLVVPGAGLAAEVEARYLAGAGVGSLVVAHPAVAEAAREVDGRVRVEMGEPGVEPAIPEWSRELDPAAREVAVGAHRALVAVRSVVLVKESDASLA